MPIEVAVGLGIELDERGWEEVVEVMRDVEEASRVDIDVEVIRGVLMEDTDADFVEAADVSFKVEILVTKPVLEITELE